MLSNSASTRQLNNPLGQKVLARNPNCRSTINFGQLPSNNRPFTRKPLNQADQISVQSSKNNQKQQDLSYIDKSLLQTHSVISVGNSLKQTKFVRTAKMGFLSPKSSNKSIQKSPSANNLFGIQSVILKSQKSQSKSKRPKNNSIQQKQEIISQSSVEQNQIYLHKSISSSNLFNRTNKTRTMILSKFNQLSKKQPSKDKKNALQTSLYTACVQNQKEEKNKLQKMNKQLKRKNQQIQQVCDEFSQENQNLKYENKKLKEEISKLNKRVNDLILMKGHGNTQEKTFGKTNQQLMNNACTSPKLTKQKSLTSNMNILSNQFNDNCHKCEQKQKSNQKQVAYFENVIKKRQLEISTLKRKQSQLTQQNSQLSTSLQQTKMKLNELLQNQKISSENEHKLQECINELKQEIAKLKDELRYLKIENSVLLKIKNENLKLKIDITKIQDEKDYFKMKVIQINKKHNSSQNSNKNISDRYTHNRDKSQPIRKNNTQKSKKFYLDSTETQQIDFYDTTMGRRKNKSKSAFSLTNKNDHFDIQNKHNVSKQTDTQATNYADALFDLTSQQSEKSF